jgi:hypothetical protein
MGKSAQHILKHDPTKPVTKAGTPSAGGRNMTPLYPIGMDPPKKIPGGVTPSLADEPKDKGAQPTRR